MNDVSSQQTGGQITMTGMGLRSTVIGDATEQAAMQPWIKMECFQLGRGSRLGQMDTLNLGDLQIVRERQDVAVQKLGVTPPNLCTISCCTPDPTFRFTELGAGTTDMLFFMPKNTEFDIYVPAGAQTNYVSFSQEEFLRSARVLNPTVWDRAPQQLIEIPASRHAELSAEVSRLFQTASANPGSLPDSSFMRGRVLQTILRLVTATPTDNYQPSFTERSRAFTVCRKACAFVEDSLVNDVLPTIVDICRQVGVSERTLGYAFRAYADRSPVAYLRLCRLNRVRAILRASDNQCTTVTEVATGLGFFHLGRFACDYRQVFGESPSVTLAA